MTPAEQLQELIRQVKQATFTDPAAVSDADALGILISHWAWNDWENRGSKAILQAAGSALEDCNFHTGAATLRQMAKSVRDWRPTDAPTI